MASVPDKYVIVSEAGRGAHSRMYFSLPKAQIAFVKVQNKISKTSIGFPGLKKSLVAIEVSPNRDLIYREYGILKAVKLSTAPGASEVRRNFLSVKDTGDFGPMGNEHAFLTLEAIDPPVTLEDLLAECNDKVKLPIPLVYHFFLTLVPALIFLHDELEWTHNDVKWDNFMVRYNPDTSPLSLPEFVFIDLGMAYSLKESKNQSADAKSLLGLVKQMANRAEESDDLDWVGFKRMLDGEMSGARSSFDVDKDLVAILGRRKDVAEKGRSERKVSETNMALAILEIAAQRKGRVSDDDILDAASVQV
ncbi:hypothetical protein E8E11_002872 [Didymella keratinophila]|nr:hypothetical protein E8E11_002872 [Didymella keratinophila]